MFGLRGFWLTIVLAMTLFVAPVNVLANTADSLSADQSGQSVSTEQEAVQQQPAEDPNAFLNSEQGEAAAMLIVLTFIAPFVLVKKMLNRDR